MTFCLRNQAELEEKLGKAVLHNLFEFISQGVIDYDHLEGMSYKHNMNVFTTFESSRINRIEVTMERMLDRWYEERACTLSASEASQELLRILENTCSPLVAVKLFRNTGTTKGKKLS